MAITVYKKTRITGATSNDLNGIDGSVLLDGDFAIVLNAGASFLYELDADSGAAESVPDVVIPSSNPGSKRWILKTGFLRNMIAGLVAENSQGDINHDIYISPGVCSDSDNKTMLRLTAGITKQIDNAWAGGSGAGGLFSGSVAADTWYGVFIIKKDADGSIDGGFDIDFGCSNIPTGYTDYRRVGAVLTDASSNIIQFVSIEEAGGNVGVMYKTMLLDCSVASATVRALQAVSVPPNFVGDFVTYFGSGVAGYSLITAADYGNGSDVAASSSLFTHFSNGSAGSYTILNQRMRVDSASRIAHRSSVSGGGIKIFTCGYLDRRND